MNVIPVHIIGSDAYKNNYAPKTAGIQMFQKDKLKKQERRACPATSMLDRSKENTSLPPDMKYGQEIISGRIAEGLSGGKIQLQSGETTQTLGNSRTWTQIPTTEAKGWTQIFVAYVYCGEKPSDQISRQALVNKRGFLSTADLLFPDQYVAVTDKLEVVVGDTVEAVVGYIEGNGAKAMPRTESQICIVQERWIFGSRKSGGIVCSDISFIEHILKGLGSKINLWELVLKKITPPLLSSFKLLVIKNT